MRLQKYLQEDYFEVTVEYAAMDGRAKSETWEITDVRNKKQAEKKAHKLFKNEFGKDGYEIVKIKRQKGNPGITDKAPNVYEAKLKWKTDKEYKRMAEYFVGTFGKKAKNEFMKTRPWKKGGIEVYGVSSEEELRREVLKHIDTLLKKFKV